MGKTAIAAVIGATATGKSALAVRLAERLGGEIISGDSMQVYRGMDIGTAKPSPEDKKRIPHHLIDIADITEPFSAARFIQAAGDAIKDIAGRGRVPIIAGGTGLYIGLLLSGALPPETDANGEIRELLYKKAEREGNLALHAYLREIDPASAESIHPNNLKRVVRAIEIYLVTGFTKTRRNAQSAKEGSPFDHKLFCLSCSDRETLYGRIDDRVDKMLASGLKREVYALYAKGLKDTPTASQAIGYKEFFPHFEGDVSLGDVSDNIKKNTRNYAKRQMTFFRGMNGKKEFDIAKMSADDILEAAVSAWESR